MHRHLQSHLSLRWKYKIKWFEGEAAPRSLDIVLNDADADEDSEGDTEQDNIRNEEWDNDDDDEERDELLCF